MAAVHISVHKVWVDPVPLGQISLFWFCLDQSCCKKPYRWLENCSIGKCQPRQPKPLSVETVDPNRTRPKPRTYDEDYRDPYCGVNTDHPPVLFTEL